ncbi:MAG: hypothetical protein ACLU0O_08345 [Collinsella sp.]
MSDMFEQAGGTISDLTERLGMQGETAAQRVLDELILARVRVMTAPEHGFLAHARHRRFGRGQRDLGARRVR